jgi:choline dehydrogenase-like flavoprotein
VEEKLDGHRGSPLCLWSQEFYESDAARGFVRGYEFQFGRGAQVIAEGIQNMALGRVPWGEGHHEAFRHWSGRRFSVEVCCEDLPEAHNRVTLDPVLVDGHGVPAPKISYTISENSRAMLAHGVAHAKRIMEAAGAGDLSITCPVPVAGWHLLGTCRMGTDPTRSVVNEWGRCHDVKNLFIVDGSVFVTSGGVNPTTTIQAIALYIADQMKRRLATLFD